MRVFLWHDHVLSMHEGHFFSRPPHRYSLLPATSPIIILDMSASIPVPAKERSRLLLLNIKKRLAWNLCADLLNPPLAAIGALKFDNDDSGETRLPRYWHRKIWTNSRNCYCNISTGAIKIASWLHYTTMQPFFFDFPSEEIKRSKTKEYEEKKAQLKREEAAREPELLAKLDEIVDRVVCVDIEIAKMIGIWSLFVVLCLCFNWGWLPIKMISL